MATAVYVARWGTSNCLHSQTSNWRKDAWKRGICPMDADYAVFHCFSESTNNSCSNNAAAWFFPTSVGTRGQFLLMWSTSVSGSAEKKGCCWLLLKRGHGIWPCHSRFDTLHCIAWIDNVKVIRPHFCPKTRLAALLPNWQTPRPVRHYVR